MGGLEIKNDDLVESIISDNLSILGDDDIDEEGGSINIVGDRAELLKALTQAVKIIAKWKNIDSTRLKVQIKVCLNVIDGLLKGKRNFVVTAPTGFGKTILGLMLSEMVKQANMSGAIKGGDGAYILTPNLFLQDQYQRDIEKFGLENTHAQLKGQSNYPCINDTTKTFSTRPCKSYSVKSLPEKMECGKLCPYVNARVHAIKSQTTVFNYNYFLTSMNKVYANIGGDSPFKPRAITVFDECHTIAPIVQEMFSSEFDLLDTAFRVESIFGLVMSVYGGKLGNPFDGDISELENRETLETIDFLRNHQHTLLKLTKQLGKIKNDDMFQNLLDQVVLVIAHLKRVIKIYSAIIIKYFPHDEDGNIIEEDLSDDQEQIYEHTVMLNNLCQEIKDMEFMYKEIGINTMVVDTKETKGKNINQTFVTFRCLKFDELIRKYVTEYTDISIFMSATIGDTKEKIQEFSKNHGIDDPYLIINYSDFDYSNSPILMVTPSLKMSYAEKAENMPKMLKRIQKIVFNNPKKTGLIHTGSYANMDMLKSFAEANNIDDRFVWCRTAKEKREGVRQVQWDIDTEGWSNRVLVGASLLEGVDLKDDLCRFNVFMKVPFASLGDELVKRMMEAYDGWYSWVTMQQVVQGIGRSNRHKKDYSTVYLLDGSFMGFFRNYGVLPRVISERIRYASLDSWFGGNNIETHTKVIDSKPMPVDNVFAEARKLSELGEEKPKSIFGNISDIVKEEKSSLM